VFFRFSERLSEEWTWRARGVKLVGKIVTRQCSCAQSTGRIRFKTDVSAHLKKRIRHEIVIKNKGRDKEHFILL